MVVDIRLEDLHLNACGSWESDEEICSSEVLLCGSVLNFEVLSLKIMDMELNLEFFRLMNFDSNADWNDEVGREREGRLQDSELGRMSSVLEGKTCEIDGNLISKV